MSCEFGYQQGSVVGVKDGVSARVARMSAPASNERPVPGAGCVVDTLSDQLGADQSFGEEVCRRCRAMVAMSTAGQNKSS